MQRQAYPGAGTSGPRGPEPVGLPGYLVGPGRSTEQQCIIRVPRLPSGAVSACPGAPRGYPGVGNAGSIQTRGSFIPGSPGPNYRRQHGAIPAPGATPGDATHRRTTESLNES